MPSRRVDLLDDLGSSIVGTDRRYHCPTRRGQVATDTIRLWQGSSSERLGLIGLSALVMLVRMTGLPAIGFVCSASAVLSTSL